MSVPDAGVPSRSMQSNNDDSVGWSSERENKHIDGESEGRERDLGPGRRSGARQELSRGGLGSKWGTKSRDICANGCVRKGFGDDGCAARKEAGLRH